MTADERLTSFSKYREKIVGRVKGADSPSVQGPQSSEEDLVLGEMVPSSTERLSFRETGADGNHSPFGQAKNNGYSSNSQEIPASMENVRPEGTEDQSITFASGEYFGRNVHVRHSKRIRKSPQ